MIPASVRALKHLSRDELAEFVAANRSVLNEDEALAILENPHVTSQILGELAQTPRVTGFHAVRVRLVAHRQTPMAHAVKLVHYLYWIDLLNLSVDVQVPSPIRRAVDTQLLARVEKLALGERITAAHRCSPALVKVFLYDPHPRVFESLLVNKRLREDDLLALMASRRATVEQLRMIAGDMRWSYRYPIRKALVMNPDTPRAAAASQLKYLSRRDLRSIHSNPATTVYVRRCIERLQPRLFSADAEVIDYNGGPDA
ncbi:MAG TPA: hypothetical protein VGQ76_27275 [Thermoanaerobaculia bacterium]|jgi:hypothetical protein|nr:hypothetical protein [Thermoanaerobaculia bacterium]